MLCLITFASVYTFSPYRAYLPLTIKNYVLFFLNIVLYERHKNKVKNKTKTVYVLMCLFFMTRFDTSSKILVSYIGQTNTPQCTNRIRLYKTCVKMNHDHPRISPCLYWVIHRWYNLLSLVLASKQTLLINPGASAGVRCRLWQFCNTALWAVTTNLFEVTREMKPIPHSMQFWKWRK